MRLPPLKEALKVSRSSSENSRSQAYYFPIKVLGLFDLCERPRPQKMPLGPWAIAKRLLRIQIVYQNSVLHLLLNGVIDKVLIFSAEGPGFKSQMSHFIFPFPCIKVNIFILHLAKLCMIKCLKVAMSAILSKILGFCEKQIFGSSVELYVATYFKNDFSQMLILSCGTFLSSIFVIQ